MEGLLPCGRFCQTNACTTPTQTPVHNSTFLRNFFILVQNLIVFSIERIPVWLYPSWKQQKSRCATKHQRFLLVYLPVLVLHSEMLERDISLHTVSSPLRSMAKVHHVMKWLHLSAVNSQLNYYTDLKTTFTTILSL